MNHRAKTKLSFQMKELKKNIFYRLTKWSILKNNSLTEGGHNRDNLLKRNLKKRARI